MQDTRLALGSPEAEFVEAVELDEFARRSAHGDRLAFEQLYVATGPDIFGFIAGSVRRGSDVADDLTANVYLKAWRSAATYKVGSNTYRRWLFGIARNEVRDYWRNERPEITLTGIEVEDRDSGADSADLDIHEQIRDALTLLTYDQRDVLVLRYFEGKSYAEIATLVSKREGAVRALVMRALRQMRKVMVDAAKNS